MKVTVSGLHLGMKGENPLRYVVFLNKENDPIPPLVEDGDESKAISTAAPMENKLHIFFNWVNAGVTDLEERKAVLAGWITNSKYIKSSLFLSNCFQ